MKVQGLLDYYQLAVHQIKQKAYPGLQQVENDKDSNQEVLG